MRIFRAIRDDIADTDAYVASLAPWELYRRFTTACVMAVFIIYGFEQLKLPTLLLLHMFGLVK